MIVLVAGPPRTGSMWTYNVTRALLLVSGKNILPHDLFDEVAAANKAVANAAKMAPGDTYCIKAHVLPKKQPPLSVKIINNYRDVRDAMLSYMRFMRLSDFEKGLQVAREMMSDTDHYFQYQWHNMIHIRYDDLIANPVAIVQQIDSFLGLNVALDEIEAIAMRFARHNVREMLKQLEQVVVESNGQIEGEAHEKYASLANLDGSYRIFDKETNFQTNHITSDKPGEWRNVFTREQQEKLLQITSSWLNRYGFKL